MVELISDATTGVREFFGIFAVVRYFPQKSVCRRDTRGVDLPQKITFRIAYLDLQRI
jgi:hypothetical protein